MQKLDKKEHNGSDENKEHEPPNGNIYDNTFGKGACEVSMRAVNDNLQGLLCTCGFYIMVGPGWLPRFRNSRPLHYDLRIVDVGPCKTAADAQNLASL